MSRGVGDAAPYMKIGDTPSIADGRNCGAGFCTVTLTNAEQIYRIPIQGIFMY